MVANDLGVDTIHDQLKQFGFGELTGIDIAGESKGLLPSTEWKRKAYKRPEQQKWYAGETISLGIGQGYNNYTIVQLADAVSSLANNGVRMKPHLVKEVVDVTTHQEKPVAPQVLGKVNVTPEHLAIVKRAMIGVNIEGTGAAPFKGAKYTSAGKTGTAQVITIKQGEKYNASRIDERQRDHALFIAYAPAEDPQIALAMIVENGGFGASSAAPIARRVFDFELLGQYPSLEDMAAVREAKATAPIGTPRGIDAAWPPTDAGASPAASPASSAGMPYAAAVQAAQTVAAAFAPAVPVAMPAASAASAAAPAALPASAMKPVSAPSAMKAVAAPIPVGRAGQRPAPVSAANPDKR
jgi:penicillin-binding protein 2